jgi:hypothetical protein
LDMLLPATSPTSCCHAGKLSLLPLDLLLLMFTYFFCWIEWVDRHYGKHTCVQDGNTSLSIENRCVYSYYLSIRNRCVRLCFFTFPAACNAHPWKHMLSFC